MIHLPLPPSQGTAAAAYACVPFAVEVEPEDKPCDNCGAWAGHACTGVIHERSAIQGGSG